MIRPINVPTSSVSMAGSFILSTAYGIKVRSENDPYIKMAKTSLHAMACAGNSGAYLVDSLPFRTYNRIIAHEMLYIDYYLVKHVPPWFPGADFQVQAREWRKSVTGMA